MKTTLAALVIAGAVFAPSALADTNFPFTFEYDATSVQTEQGAAETHDRLLDEVTKACEAVVKGTPGLSAKRVQNECVKDVMSTALNEISQSQQIVLASAK